MFATGVLCGVEIGIVIGVEIEGEIGLGIGLLTKDEMRVETFNRAFWGKRVWFGGKHREMLMSVLSSEDYYTRFAKMLFQDAETGMFPGGIRCKYRRGS